MGTGSHVDFPYNPKLPGGYRKNKGGGGGGVHSYISGKCAIWRGKITQFLCIEMK